MISGDGWARRRVEVRALLDAWPSIPAFLRDRHMTVIAANPLARAVSPGFAEGVNLVRYLYLDPSAGPGYEGFDQMAMQVTADLRDSLEQHGEDGWFRRLVGELSTASEHFATQWASESPPDHTGVLPVRHDQVGPMTLSYHQLRIPDDYEDVLVVFSPADDESRRSLARLADLVAQDH